LASNMILNQLPLPLPSHRRRLELRLL
jgi:hypothetical protein